MQPIPFLQFVETHKGNSELAKPLPADFYSAPTKQYLPKSAYANKRYNGQGLASATSICCDMIFEPTRYLKQPIDAKLVLKVLDVFGCLPNDNKQTAMQFFLYSKAAKFQFSMQGSCSYRAAYAAIRLANIFKGVLTVYLQSNVERDHFVVQLGTKDKEWFVYDPLTNSDLIFPHALYEKMILPTFSKVQDPAPQFKLKISPEMAEDYEKRYPRIEQFHIELWEQNPSTKESLMKDKYFRFSLLAAGYNQKNLEATCEKTIVEFAKLVAAKKQKPSTE